MPDPIFRAGAAVSNITPRLGVSINGGMSNRLATHVHDELSARCLVLDNEETRLALVICDSCMIPREVLDAAKHLVHGHTGLPTDRMLISATHTHSAPASASVFQTDLDEEYQEFLAVRIADGIRRAINNLAPAKIGWATGQLPGQVFNRRWRMRPTTIPTNPFGEMTEQAQMNPPAASPNLIEPVGPTDPQVVVLSVQHADGRPLAAMAVYSLHYVGGTGPGHISSDYYGVFADRIQELLRADRQDPPFLGMLFNGTSGDINNVNFRQPRPRQDNYAQIRVVAHALADEVHRVVGTVEHKTWVPLAMRQASLELGVRLPTPMDIARAQDLLRRGNGEELRLREEIYARETMLLQQYPARITTLVQALRIGDLGIGSTPCETFVETGLDIKERSPFRPTCVISLANDYAGYLPPPRHHQLGGYETWRARSSFLAIDAEPLIRNKIVELLQGLQRK